MRTYCAARRSPAGSGFSISTAKATSRSLRWDAFLQTDCLKARKPMSRLRLGRRCFFDDRPRMTVERRPKSAQPIHRQLPLAEFQVADLLVGGAQALRQVGKRQAARLTQFAKSIGG